MSPSRFKRNFWASSGSVTQRKRMERFGRPRLSGRVLTTSRSSRICCCTALRRALRSLISSATLVSRMQRWAAARRV